jgi:N-acyl-D-aspartate/D-glutamate deacylase
VGLAAIKKAKKSRVLSEGEQRALSLACFLAESHVAERKSGIKRADIKVIDFERIGNDMPEMVFVLPMGSGRLIPRASCNRMTMVNGIITRLDDKDTGARPGRLVRSQILATAA